MSTTTEHYVSIIEGLQEHISRVDRIMGVYECLQEESGTNENIVAAPILFLVIAPVLFDHLLLEAAKIYEKKGDRSIYKLVKLSQNLYSKIEWKGPKKISLNEIEKQQQVIESRDALLEKIKSRRDKTLAHLDKAYFNNPERIGLDFPVEIHDLITLLHDAQKILAMHALAVGIGARISFGDWFRVFTERMVTTLREHRG